VEEATTTPTTKWPLDEEWERSWLASKDWFQEPLKPTPTSRVQSGAQSQPNKDDDGECGWAVAQEECEQATPGDRERGQATAQEESAPARQAKHRQVTAHKEHVPAGQAKHRQVAAHKEAEMPNLLVNLEQEQQNNPFLGAILTFLLREALPEDNSFTQHVHLEAEQCKLFNGLLYHHAWPQHRSANTCTLARLAIPTSHMETVMHTHHNDLLGGHLGQNRTIATIKHKYWWPHMSSKVAKWVASCKTCQQQKAPQQGKNGPLQLIPVATQPFEHIGLDLMGPFQESDSGNKWILIMIDYLTKWPVIMALPDKQAETMARAFIKQLVCNHRAPECLLSNQGREFLNEVLISVNADLCVHCLKMLVYHLQTDGLTECFNSTLQNMLSMYVTEHQRDWDTYIPYVLVVYWCSVNKATLEMPFYLMYGQDHYLPINILLGLPQAQSEEDTGDYEVVSWSSSCRRSRRPRSTN
jgi:hypothetical protein